MEHEQPARVGRWLAAIVAAEELFAAHRTGGGRHRPYHRALTDVDVAKHGGRLVRSTGDVVLLWFLGA